MATRTIADFKRAAVARAAEQPIAARVIRLVRAGKLDWYVDSFPFPTFRHYRVAMRARERLARMPPIVPSEARQRAEEIARQAEQEIGESLERAWTDTRFTDEAAEALAAGASYAAVGAGIGSAAGPIGTVIGAAIGFIAGIIHGIIPIEKWDLYARWRAVLDGMTPDERLAVLRAIRALSNRARDKEGRPRYPAFRLIDGWIRNGLDNDVYILFQMILERDSFPLPRIARAELAAAHANAGADPLGQVGAVLSAGASLTPSARHAIEVRTAHALVAAVADVDDGHRAYDAHEVQRFNQITRVFGSAWLRPAFGRLDRETAGDLRRRARELGIVDIGQEPEEPDA